MYGTFLPTERLGTGGAPEDPLLASGGRYLVGFDGSQASALALRWATERAQQGSHELVLVGVAGLRSADGSGTGGMTATELTRILGRRVQDIRDHDGDLAVSTRLASGDVALELARAAEPGDVLVIGSDKTGYAQGRIYGLRSLQLAASATATVVVVPAVDLRMRAGVVVGLDDAPSALDIVRIGAREAALRRSQLLLVHAVPRISSAEARVRGDRVLARARLAAWEEEPEVDVTLHLVPRRPADAILNLSRARALLLVGRSRRGGPLGVGETLHELLMNANVPIGVVR